MIKRIEITTDNGKKHVLTACSRTWNSCENCSLKGECYSVFAVLCEDADYECTTVNTTHVFKEVVK